MGFIRPSFIDNMGWHMGEVYGAITDQILINLARYFPYYKPGQPVPQSSFEYQANMLAEMGQVTDETVKIIRNGLQGEDAALQNLLQQAIMESVKKAQPELIEGVKKGLLNPTAMPIVSPNQMNAFRQYYTQAADKLNLVNTVMLESTKQAYQATVSDIVSRINVTQRALDIGAGEAVTGVSSWNQALTHAINRMKDNGITGFIDHGGHRWSAEAYVSMDIRTTVANTARAAVWETNQNFGNDLYLVSYHNGARPLCYPYQNMVVSRDDRYGVTYDLDGNEIHYIAQSATSYGQPAGLFGINCKHYPTPFIPGVSLIRGEPQSKEENDRVYEESQQQRALERKIREEKRDLMMLKEQGAPDEIIKAQRKKIRQTDDEIDAFCDETGRHRRQNREGVYTRREFPDPDTYDVTTFEREQKDVIEKYFMSGGSQQTYTFGQMTPNEPIIPATPPTVAPVSAPQSVASQVTAPTYTDAMFNNVSGLRSDAQKAMAQKLLSSGNDDAINVFGKYADDLKVYNNRMKKNAYFSPVHGGIAVNVSGAVAGSDYEEPLQVLFHEFGHNIDWLAGGKNNYTYLSNTPINGVRLQSVIKSDFTAFMQTMGASTNSELIDLLKAEGMDKKTCGNISDILEYCTGKSYPLGIGHGASYHKKANATEKEFFAEVLDSSISNGASYAQMQRLFPNAVNMVWQMIKGVV
jgi:hypothetical protein